MGAERVITNDPTKPLAAIGDSDIAIVGAGIQSSTGSLGLGVPGLPVAVRIDSTTGLLQISKDGGTTWDTAMSGATGTAEIDFGANPGGNAAELAITGQASIATSSIAQAWMLAASTTDHNAEEHMLVPVKLTCGNIIAGTGFTIYARTDWRLNGKFKVAWAWQ